MGSCVPEVWLLPLLGPAASWEHSQQPGALKAPE